MTEENQQSIFTDMESRIHEREWNKSVKKIRTARYALFFLALINAISFCNSYVQGIVNYWSLAITVFYLFLFYLSRSKPFISCIVGGISHIILFVFGSY